MLKGNNNHYIKKLQRFIKSQWYWEQVLKLILSLSSPDDEIFCVQNKKVYMYQYKNTCNVHTQMELTGFLCFVWNMHLFWSPVIGLESQFNKPGIYTIYNLIYPGFFSHCSAWVDFPHTLLLRPFQIVSQTVQNIACLNKKINLTWFLKTTPRGRF